MALVLLFGACSTSTAESADPQAKGLSQLTTVTPSTSMSTPTTLRPTTESSSTVVTPTPPSVSTTAAEEAAAQAVLDKAAVWRSCTAIPASCDTSTLAAVASDSVLDSLRRTVAEWTAAGLALRPPVDPSHARDYVIDIELGSDGDWALVTHCQVDGSVLVEMGSGPDGEDVVVDERVLSLLAESQLRRLDDGVWRVFDVELIREFDGGGGCEAARE